MSWNPWAAWEAWERLTVRWAAQMLQGWGRLAAAADKRGADARRGQ